jgi:UDP-N-acetylmuramoyl-tripeptide--D-alanyl-D-alanine ligase
VTAVQLRAAELADATGGTLKGADATVQGATADSRLVVPGNLFVALRAARDGHDFVPDAVRAGAAACLVERPVPAPSAVVVPDTAAALLSLGGYARGRLGERLVGITGSVGKTSTKDLAAAVLRQQFRTHANERSFNNELGVPLTLLGAPDDTEATVIEMGMRGFGHIAVLCGVARPTMGVVTSVAKVHTELVGDLDGVARAKGELVEALPADGHAVLNAEDERVRAMASRTDATVVLVGEGGEVRAERVRLGDDLRARFRLVSAWGTVDDVVLAARGLHQVTNALAAAAVGLVWGVAPAAVAAGLGEASLSPWRMEVGRSLSGATVINDAYNAGPTSMAAALHTLAAVSAKVRVAVLGSMTELGDDGAGDHRRIAELAHELGIRVVAVNEGDYGNGAGVIHVADAAAAMAFLGPLGPDDAVLVKASRAVGLEVVAAGLLGT